MGRYVPPSLLQAPDLMFDALEWGKEAAQLSPVLNLAMLHCRFESIHPYADGNGQTGRALASRELLHPGFDTQYILRDHDCMVPAEIWEALGISRQGALDLLNPFLEVGIAEKVGGKKIGRYALRRTRALLHDARRQL